MIDPAGHEQDLAIDPGRARGFVQARKHHHLDRALEVLEGGDRHGCLGLGDDGPHPGHDSTHDDPLLVKGLVAQVTRVGRHERSDRLGNLFQRMVREVQPEKLLLPAQALPGRCLGDTRQWRIEAGPILGGQVEQRHLAADPVALGHAGGIHRIVQAGQDLGRMAKRGQGSDPRQRFEDALVGQAQVDPLAEVDERREVAVGTRRDD